MPKIYWTDPAIEDLDGVYDFISLDSVSSAQIFVEQLLDSTRRLEDFPLSGRVVPEYNQKGIREVIFKGYRIVYKLISADRIDILTVFLGAREVEELLGQL